MALANGDCIWLAKQTNKMINLIGKINIDLILKDYNRLEKDIVWQNYHHKGKQAGLQYEHLENQWGSVRSKNSPDLNYNLLNPFFKDTIFEKLINDFHMFRTRFIWLGANTCYYFHRDSYARIHIPIVTSQHSYFIFRNGLIENLELGSVYLVDTRMEHTAINGNEEARLHLVGSVSN